MIALPACRLLAQSSTLLGVLAANRHVLQLWPRVVFYCGSMGEVRREKGGCRLPDRVPAATAPVEYAVAVDRYLAAMRLDDASRRVYRIALATWAWPLVGRPAPLGKARRGAAAPLVPLSLLDDTGAPSRLRAAAAERAATADPRTRSRELSILRGAVAWWRAQGWIRGDPVGELRSPAIPAAGRPVLGRAQVTAIFGLRASLREQAFWHLLYETAAGVERLLALDIDDLDRTRTRLAAASPGPRRLGGAAARLLPLLLVGRVSGPVFLTDRRAGPLVPARDRCPLTGRGRLSYRRAAELFTTATRPLDPAGDGWTFRQLRAAGVAARQQRGRTGTDPGDER
jgi:integrase